MFRRTLWGVSLYLALQLGLFFIVRQALHKTLAELAVPFLAFSVPGVVVLPLARWLRGLEEQGSPARRLALGWATCAGLFFSAVVMALVYSSVELRLTSPSDALSFVLVGALGVPAVFFSMYRSALLRISSRAVKTTDLARPK
jgi:hypothetical protein